MSPGPLRRPGEDRHGSDRGGVPGPVHPGALRGEPHQASTIAQKKSRLGDRRLDQIRDQDIARLKADLKDLSPKTVNNVLVTLSTMLKAAREWGVIPYLPCTIKLLKVSVGTVEFYEQPDYERLVAAARELDPRIELLVLLGGDAGLRRGEIIALEQTDCDTRRGILHVRRSEWKGHVTLPKGGRERQVNMTDRLRAVLTASKHLRGERVLWRDDGYDKVTAVLFGEGGDASDWRWPALRRSPSRSSPGTRPSPRRCATCTSRPRPSPPRSSS